MALLQACSPAGMETGRGSPVAEEGWLAALLVPLSSQSPSRSCHQNVFSEENAAEATAERLWGTSPVVGVCLQLGAGTAPCYGCAIPPRAPPSLQRAIYQTRASGFIFF